jgi:hypothetical protein
VRPAGKLGGFSLLRPATDADREFARRTHHDAFREVGETDTHTLMERR